MLELHSIMKSGIGFGKQMFPEGSSKPSFGKPTMVVYPQSNSLDLDLALNIISYRCEIHDEDLNCLRFNHEPSTQERNLLKSSCVKLDRRFKSSCVMLDGMAQMWCLTLTFSCVKLDGMAQKSGV